MRYSASRELEVGLESDTDRQVGTCPAGARRLGRRSWGSWGGGKDEPHDGEPCAEQLGRSGRGCSLAPGVLLVVNLGPS